MATPGNALLNELQTVLAADTSGLGSATAMKVHLAQSAFTPSPGLTIGSLTEATFTGYAALLAGTGTQTTYNDPITGARTILLKEPAGGWHWQATNATGLPQTIFGYWVSDNAATTLWGSGLITPNVLLSAAGDGVDIGNISFKIPTTALF